MNITLNIDEISLATAVDQVAEYDDDGDLIGPRDRTVGELVANMILERLVRDNHWNRLRDQMLEVRREVIREALLPVVEKALSESFQKTNSYGEPIAGTQATMREVIADEARKLMTEPADSYHRDKGTRLQVMVRKEVEAALGAEVKDAVKQAREQVSAEIGAMVASAVQAGLKAR